MCAGVCVWKTCIHTHGREKVQSSARKDQRRVLATEFKCRRRKLRCSCLCYASAYDVAANECDMGEARIAGKGLDCLWTTCHKLDKIAGHATCVHALVHGRQDVL